LKYIPFYLICIYLVGITGMLSPYADTFVLLTPLNLFVSLSLITLYQQPKDANFWLFITLSGLLGFIIEAIGTSTGVIFGEYTYGQTLGFKILSTPLTMFINWATLMYCNLMLINQLYPKINKYAKSLIAATLMVLMDFLIEPTAIKFDFWSWQSEGINDFLVAPLQNYVAWFIISFVLYLFLTPLVNYYQNKAAVWLLFLQFIFFAILDYAYIPFY